MVRTNLSQIRKIFRYSESENKLFCTLEKCKAVIKGNHASNLKRHVKQFHVKDYKEFQNEKLSALQQRAGASSSSEPQKKRMCETNQCAIDEMFSKTIRIIMNEKTLKNACLELVTINDRPFKLMDDSGFRKILNPLQEGMRANCNINADNIREKIGVKANDVRYGIKLEVEHRLVSLKADVATCRDRSILGVNLQFTSDGKVQLHTLAMKELKKNHTGFYLKTFLDKVIEQYGIKSNQIYSITTDNDANMLKYVRLFSEEDVQYPKELIMLSSQVVAAGRATQKNSVVMKTIAVLLIT